MDAFQRLFDRALEIIAAAMMTIVTLIIVAGFLFRWAGHSLVWYDEVAAISLCWLTYYGGALAALRGAHIGFPGLVNAMPANWRVAKDWALDAQLQSISVDGHFENQYDRLIGTVGLLVRF